MNRFIEMLLPERLRTVKPVEDEARLKLLSTVPATDNCLRAVEDILRQNMEQEFYRVIDPHLEDLVKLRACEGLRVHYYALQKIEHERLRAEEWKRLQE